MTPTLFPREVGTECLSWIVDELRKEVARREARPARRPPVHTALRSLKHAVRVAGCAAVSAVFLRLFGA